MNRRQLGLGAVAAIAVIAAVLAGLALARSNDGGSGDSPRAITVTGTGVVDAVPDVADVSLGVSATAKTARAAQTAVDEQMTKVISTLKAQGVGAADLQTSQVSLSPSFGRTGGTVVGYTAANTVTARIRELAKAGEIVAAAAGAGANEISGPTLTVSDEKGVYRDALKSAYGDARSHADAIAAASGDTVGRMRSASEGSESGPIPFEAKAADSSATPIEPGTVEVQATVTATFDVG